MRYVRFALTGMVLLLCLLGSCSFGKGAPEEVVSAEDETTLTEWEETKDEEKEDEEEEETEEGDEDEELPEETPPATVFLGLKAVSENAVVFEFSLPVTVAELDFSPELKIEAIVYEDSTVTVTFEEDLEPGQWFNAALLVEDEYENTVDVQVPFRFRHSRIPEMLITELRTEYNSKYSRGEFIEFKMLSDGNLGGLRVFAVGNTKTPMIYQFEPVEVKSEEYVVLHLRTLEESCKNEYGEDLTESDGTDSSPTARDFWVPGVTKLLHITDIVYVLDQDDWVLDAVMIAEKPEAWNKKNYFTEAAEFLFSKGAWSSTTGTMPGIEDAVDSSKTTDTRTICRDETAGNTHTAADWYVTVGSGMTPGKPNNPNRFTN